MVSLDRQEAGNGKKAAWYERKVKAKLTVTAIALVTVAFYITLLSKAPIEWFVYYSAVIAMLVGAMSAADVMNTLSYNKTKNAA